MKSLLIKSAIASGVVLSLATFTRPVMATSFTVSIEDPTVQNAQSSNLVNARVQNFDASALTTGYSTTGFTWADDAGTNIGSYTNTLIVDKDQYGGAGGTGKYFDVDTNRSGGKQTVSTLNLTTAQSYFGLWWSAGDANNVLTFLSQGQVVQTMTTKDVVNYIANLPNKASYYSNPNSAFKGQNSGEPYAFINFYDVGGTFDQVQFTNVGGTGFESDNHTVATGYKSITGNVVVKAVPESSSLLGVFVIGFVGATSVLTGRVKKKSALQLS
ncbi:Npun_F0296 family exosortase-dependent surface protein [Nostoc sp.]|uniref:Npun_F0296 family exosortase-dependent surface protein n=1 Tax=Nostoc sp. TaxID=1180 RepID=UPI002FF8D639